MRRYFPASILHRRAERGAFWRTFARKLSAVVRALLNPSARNGERSRPMLLASSSLIFRDDGGSFAKSGEAVVQSDS
jgi:hypothetical protein